MARRDAPGGRAPRDWASIARADPTRFLEDVFVRPSVRPLAGWLIGALVAIVFSLTIVYAPGAVEQKAEPYGPGSSGIIPVSAGYITIGIVTALALIAGWEPIVRRAFESVFYFSYGEWRSGLPAWLRVPLAALGALVRLVWRTPSTVFSFLDWLLARPLALLAGAGLRPMLARYAVLGFWVGGSAWLAWQAPAPWGLAGVVTGLIAVFAVVRRWTWVERDRETFFVARSAEDNLMRIGFAEDLRDEALTAIVFLFALVPLGLRQVDIVYDAFDLIDAATGQSIGGQPSALQWIGFFGAELAKTAPFVDWSEVFHVANGSPIVAQTALGEQVVFAMRATLDLLLLAAVLQAVQIAARVAEQNAAFAAGRLPILDPFAERARFRPAGLETASHEHAIAAFPSYERKRLAEIAAGAPNPRRASTPILIDTAARRAALSLLARQYPGEETTTKITQRVREDRDLGLRRHALALAAERRSAKAEAAMLAALNETGEGAAALRADAARALGRLRAGGAREALMRRLMDQAEAPDARAHAGLALAKLKTPDVDMHLRRLFDQAEGATALTVACALTMLAQERGETPAGASAVANLLTGLARDLASRGIRSALGEADKMAAIPAGSFAMGAAEGEENASDDEYPQHEVSVPAFEMGVYAVTFEEYDAFCDATGARRPGDEAWGRQRRPVINVSWEDARTYCDWLQAWSGERFRLPSEAEWEYACRAGTTTRYAFGESISRSDAHYSEGSYGSARQTVEVGSFRPNAFGLYDMHGNVWEWCADAFNANYDGAPSDGSAWLTGETSLRVLRGGSWDNDPWNLRSANRGRNGPTNRLDIIGFRLARTVLPPAA